MHSGVDLLKDLGYRSLPHALTNGCEEFSGFRMRRALDHAGDGDRRSGLVGDQVDRVGGAMPQKRAIGTAGL